VVLLSTLTYTATGTYSGTAPGTLVNTASLTAPTIEDPVASNNAATDEDTVAPPIPLASPGALATLWAAISALGAALLRRRRDRRRYAPAPGLAARRSADHGAGITP